MDRTSNFKAVLAERTSPVPRKRYWPVGGRAMRKLALVSIVAIDIASLASPATAASGPSTRLVRCAEQSCLQIRGHRDDPATIIAVNGHVVPVEGEHSWRVHLPVEVVREWSAPHARTIEVTLQDPETRRETVASADLPIGLLGGTADLASLVISLR
jgi:hypothetical protein